MDPMQYPVESAEPGEHWSPLKEVFHFDGPKIMAQ
jgi:hypothetical protein